jgi:hypothetical protein
MKRKINDLNVSNILQMKFLLTLFKNFNWCTSFYVFNDIRLYFILLVVVGMYTVMEAARFAQAAMPGCIVQNSLKEHTDRLLRIPPIC